MVKNEKLGISVVIPAYNEEKRIKKSLKKIFSYLDRRGHDYEVIVVDDGSVDATADIVKSFGKKNLVLIQNQKNSGKGFSVRRGMLAAKKKYALFSDADLSTPIEDIEKFLRLKDRYDVIIGSRALKKSEVKIRQPFYRVIIGKIFNFFVHAIVMGGVKDTQCGFKFFKRDAAKKIFSKQRLNGFGFDVEVLFIARKYGYRIKEIPIEWFNSPATKVSPIKDSVKMFTDLIMVRINDLRGVY